MTKFWNLVRKSKSATDHRYEDIEIGTLRQHFQAKFGPHENNRTQIGQAQEKVDLHYNSLEDSILKAPEEISVSMLMEYTTRMKSICATGLDGITIEHIKYAGPSGLTTGVCRVLNLCLMFGIVPKCFTEGLMVPLLKKQNSDPSQAKKLPSCGDLIDVGKTS